MSTTVRSSFPKLSTALLASIFEYFCDSEPIQIPLQPLDKRYVLSLVCTTWVDTVRATSSLWSNVHFTGPLPGTAAYESDLVLYHFALCAARSRQNPLTIEFDMVCEGWAFSIVRSVIIPHANRIKTLCCPIYRNRDIIKLLMVEEGRFSILESMEIVFINEWTKPLSSFSLGVCLRFNGFGIAPRLRRATVRLLNGLHPHYLHLPWCQLTALDLGTTPMPLHVFVKILHATASRLEEGFFYVKFMRPLNPHLELSSRSITMDALRMLRLRLLFPSKETRIFRLLSFPALQNAFLEMHDKFQDWDIPLYTELLRASTRTLRELRMTDYPPPGIEAVPGTLDSTLVLKRRHCETAYHTLEKFFDCIVNVQYLNLPLGVNIHAPTVEKMASCALLPHLYSLEFGTVNAPPVLAMIRQRRMMSLNSSLVGPSEGGPLRVNGGHQPFGLRYINILIPRQAYTEEEKVALVEEVNALWFLGVTCYIRTTDILPLPMMNFPRNLTQFYQIQRR